MKIHIAVLSLAFILFSCKKETSTKVKEEKQLTIAEKIANAHGFQKWNNVKEIAFTFNVDRDSSHYERSWIWKPKTNEVTAISATDTLTFLRKNVDSLSLRADQGFINDKFWLLPAFQLVWDSGTQISKPIKEKAPISKKELNKITLLYIGNGGYTPGDAYDFYYNEDYFIEEWIFRKSNSEKPSMTTSFSEYKTIENISFPTKSIKEYENWSLYFTDIQIETE